MFGHSSVPQGVPASGSVLPPLSLTDGMEDGAAAGRQAHRAVRKSHFRPRVYVVAANLHVKDAEDSRGRCAVM